MASETLELRTGPRLATGGEAIARAPDGRVVFVAGGAPEERLSARVTKSEKRLLRAELLEVLEPSAMRQAPECPHHDACGGCGLMHLAPEAGAEQVFEAGLDTLRRIGRLDPTDARLETRLPLGTRTRARLAVEPGRIAPRGRRSHRATPIERCVALHPALEAVRSRIESLSSDMRLPPRLELRLATDGAKVAVELPEPLAALAEVLRAAGIHVAGGPLELRDRAGPAWWHPAVFQQASLDGNDALLAEVERVLAARPSGSALELYAGSGNFTRLLARRFERVLAVELAGPAVRLAQRLELPGVRWRTGSAAEVVGTEGGYDAVLVDPPRAGLETEVRAALAGMEASLLVYVSCDVGTLARDLRALVEGGWALERVRGFDIYPRSPHMEWVVTLGRPERERRGQ